MKTRNALCSGTIQSVGVIARNEKSCAQQLSKVSERLSKMRENLKCIMLNESPKYRSCLKILKTLCSTAIYWLGVNVQNVKDVTGDRIRAKCYVLRVMVLL